MVWSQASTCKPTLDPQEHPVRRRLFAQVATVAVIGSTLAFGQAPATAAPDPTAASATTNAQTSLARTLPSAPGPLDVAKGIKGLYDHWKTCLANEAIGQPCGASDSDNIRESLRLLKDLGGQVNALQKTLESRLDDLDLGISRAELATYQKDFSRISKSVPRAVQAFSAFVDCEAARLNGKATCLLYSETGTSNAAPIEDATRSNLGAFLDYTDGDSLPQSIPNTVARYAGTNGVLSADSYANALWRFAKLKVDIEAGASQSVFRRSPYATFVTPSMSEEVNAYLKYYGDLLGAHAEVLYLRAVVQRDLAAAAGDTASATRFQDSANRIRRQIAADIESTDANSVRGVDLTYRLTRLDKGEIIMASPDGTGAMVFITSGGYWGARVMRDTDVAALGQGLRLYGKYSTLARNEPEAFPEKGGWYVVRGETLPLLCDSGVNPLQSGRNNVNWLPSVIRQKDRYRASTIDMRVRLLDGTPEVPEKDEGSFPGRTMRCGDGRGKNYDVDIYRYSTWPPSDGYRIWQASELRYPMTYDWDRFTFKKGVGKWDEPFGVGVAIQETTQWRDSLLIDASANQLVRWPDNFTPSGMPPGY